MAQSRRIVRAAASKDFSAGRLLITTAIAIMLVLAAIAISAAAEEPDYAVERAAMVRTIVSYSAEVNSATGRDRIAPGVLEAMGIVPRHEFVPKASSARLMPTVRYRSATARLSRSHSSSPL